MKKLAFAHSVQITIQDDLVSKLSKTNPLDALIELIWNSLDADANTVKVNFNYNAMNKLESIFVMDDGIGIQFKDAVDVFKNLGGSKKKNKLKTDLYGRFLHGKEGKGRLKAFSLGARLEWHINFKDDLGQYYSYSAIMHLNNPKDVKISKPIVLNAPESQKSGVRVEIYDAHKSIKIDSDKCQEKLLETFAIYLHEYRDVAISINNEKLDSNKMIEDISIHSLDPTIYEERHYSTVLKVTEWKIGKNSPSILLSCHHGIPYISLETKWNYPGKKYTAYIQTEATIEMINNNQIDFAHMNTSIKDNLKKSEELIRAHFRAKNAAAAEKLVDKWKLQDIYPYSGTAYDPIEIAERQVFDIVASSVSSNISDFEDTSYKNRKFQFRLLKQALEANPESLQFIIEEVLNLSKSEQDDLARLLKDVKLAAVITASKIVTDRISFINGLENLINSKKGKKGLEERKQLHRIIAENCWIFGDEFFISVDDQGLTECLKQHKKVIGEETEILDGAVKHPTKTKGIVDLMLSRTTRNNQPNTAHHLVIELKRPRVKIGRAELNQILDYSDAIREDSRFSKTKAKWTFVALSLDRDMSLDSRYEDIENGVIRKKDDYVIYTKTWAEIFDECKARLQFFQEKLQYKVSSTDSFEYLQKNYSDYLVGLETIHEISD